MADITAALAAVEAAWELWYGAHTEAINIYPDTVRLDEAVADLLAALRAVRSSGAVVAVVSREAVTEATRYRDEEWLWGSDPDGIKDWGYAAGMLRQHGLDPTVLTARILRDLAPLLKAKS